MVKFTVRMSFSSGHPRTSVFTPRTRFYPRTVFTVHVGENPSARTLGCVRAGQERGKEGGSASARTHACVHADASIYPEVTL
jgi:hypothetical protein